MILQVYSALPVLSVPAAAAACRRHPSQGSRSLLASRHCITCCTSRASTQAAALAAALQAAPSR